MKIEDVIRLKDDEACPGVKATQDVVIREVDGWSQTVSIFQPEKRPASPMPCSVQVHGGGFIHRYLSPNIFLARWFALELGITTVLPLYRLGTPDAPSYPKPVEDTAFCWEWMQVNAAEWGIDVKKMTIGGSSAGGTLSTLSLVKGLLPGCIGLLDYWGPVDFVARWFDNGEKQGGDMNLLGADYPDNVTLYHEASAVSHIKPGLPPALFIYGIQDPVVHRRQGQLAYSAWKQSGARAEHAEFDNIGHGIVGDNSDQMIKVAERSVAFIRTLI